MYIIHHLKTNVNKKMKLNQIKFLMKTTACKIIESFFEKDVPVYGLSVII